MDKQQAQKIIKETFESSFDKSSFTEFINNLLNRIEDSPFTYQGNYIPDAYKQYIKTLERIGKFSDGENSIDILVIILQKETSLERARTMQRNFIAWYLNGSRGGEMKDAALAAFVSPDNEDWRFSLVKMDYKFEQSKSGRMKVKEEFTPARRWSFLVGKNEKSHTAQISLVSILKNDEQDPTLEEIEKAFDIETVTKEFFREYRGLFLRTKDELDSVVKKDPKIKADFEAKGVDTVNFAKKLLGQIVFLYFLQKKGWFGVGRDDDWGTGSKQFLRELFDKKHSDYNNFYNDILEPLFYESLRIDRSHDDGYYKLFNCKIPFLNGGLFDPIGSDRGYNWVNTDILLPDKLFSNKNETKEGDIGDGILDIFDRYNFTVKEDEPLEKEVAIDPELLGKAYEKFNAIRPDNYAEFKKALKSGKTGEENKFNKKFGVYYTPREIVHYMCQQSLINYLYTVTQASSLRGDSSHKQDACDTTSSLSLLENIYYDTGETVAKRQRNLPHWDQDGKAYFVTFRLYDSIPKEAAENIRQERQKWFERNKITDTSEVEKLSRENQIEYYRLFSKRYDELLDNGHGSCILANSDCKKIVEEALSHFNNKRYYLDKYVVMPNHVHVIVNPMKSWSLEKILHSWKSFTANAINKVLNRQGELWMHESFDHIIRNPEQLERIRKYIEDNPRVTQASSLKEKEEKDHKQDACVTIPKEDIEALIHTGEQLSENEATSLLKEKLIAEGKQKTTKNKPVLPESIKNNAAMIDNKLAEITVCDPAVGSGAFPVGMMSEIVKARNVLSVLRNHKQVACDTYNFKRRCIEHSLYGVDIDPGAVEIAKLRLWLSLVVDEDDIKNIKPLPNLDYKIMQGNSLIELLSTELLVSTTDHQRIELVNELKKAKDELFNITIPSQKEKMRRHIDTLILNLFKYDIYKKIKTLKDGVLIAKSQQLLFKKEKEDEKKIREIEIEIEELKNVRIPEPTEHFEWHINFSEIFQDKGGFDVVIGNPPYVEHKKLKGISSELKNFYSTYSGTADLYVYFYENGVENLRQNGTLSFITSNKFIKTKYGENLRKYFTKHRIDEIIDFTDVHVFEALVASCIFSISRNDCTDNKIKIAFANDSLLDFSGVFEFVDKNKFFLPQKNLSEKIWQLENETKLSLKEKIDASSSMKEPGTISIFRGVTSGYNPAFIIDEKKRKELIGKCKANKVIIKSLLQGRNIRRWIYQNSNVYLLQTGYDLNIKKDYSAIYQHLAKFKAKLKVRSDQGKNWWNLRACKYYPEFEKEKIIWGLTADKWAFAYDNNNHFLLSNGYILTSNEIPVKYLLSLINSKLMEFYFGFIGIMTAGGAFTLKHETISELPIKIISNPKQKPLIEIVDKILSITKSEDYFQNQQKQSKVKALEAEIDLLVYKLYDLTPEEIKIVEGGDKNAD